MAGNIIMALWFRGHLPHSVVLVGTFYFKQLRVRPHDTQVEGLLHGLLKPWKKRSLMLQPVNKARNLLEIVVLDFLEISFHVYADQWALPLLAVLASLVP